MWAVKETEWDAKSTKRIAHCHPCRKHQLQRALQESVQEGVAEQLQVEVGLDARLAVWLLVVTCLP
jgi:hypothetical protein